MDSEDIKGELAGLSAEEAASIYFYKCRGIADKDQLNAILKDTPGIAIGASTAYTRSLQGLRYLRIDEEQLINSYCPVLAEMVGETPNFHNWPPAIEETPEAVDTPDETVEAAERGDDPPIPIPPPPPADEEVDTSQPVPSPITPSRLRKLRNGFIAVITGAAIFFVGFFSGILQPGDPAVEPTAIVVTQIVTMPPDPTQPISDGEPTREPDLVLVPTDSPQPTEESTNSSGPSGTPEPTLAPVLAAGETHRDDFSNGVDEDFWTIDAGRYDLVNGKVQVVEDLFLRVGDDSWHNYEITLKVEVASENINRGNYVCVRCGNSDAILFEFANRHWSTARPHLWIRDGGQLRQVITYHTTARNKTIFVSMVDDLFFASMDLEPVAEYRSNIESGPIVIKIHPQTVVEWIEVRRLD